MQDIIIIGAGIIGASIARELSKYKLKTLVLEKGEDVAVGTTKANSAIVHAGYDAEPGSLKGKLNARGNAMFDKLSKELDFPFKRIGSLVLSFTEDGIEELKLLKKQGEENGVPGLSILNESQVFEMEPNLNSNVKAALYAKTGAIVSPYEMTAAMAENAYINGAEFAFEAEVINIIRETDGYSIVTKNKTYRSKIVINAAGLYADKINNLVSDKKFNIIGRKGQYCLFDREAGNTVGKVIFQLPTEMGKGVLVTPTIGGNLLIGPNAQDADEKDDLTTTQEGMDEILKKAGLSIKQVPARLIITSFSGLRAHAESGDFIIGEASGADGFINAAGIESPGLSSAPAIAEMVADIIKNKLKPEINSEFNPNRPGIPKFREMSNKERNELIKKDKAYGKIVCRCETVTEGEILNAIRRPLGAKSLDGVKRRTRAGMGRCQSGFCSAKIVEILAKELNVPMTEITKFGGTSNLLTGKNKD
ncbi:MAG: NAD(P)/FAD-dependent oxidoreductase [Bacillota bacterium]|nr:NAD(P)/FAD-dependent oxidoreductase [Bacillota bacterium]